ncbi:MAG: 7-cyano-7-deazaguanine synthase, partial [Albidovulum sp.]
MVGVAPPPEHRVRCQPPLTFSGGDERLIFEIDGHKKGVSLKINKLSRRLVEALPDRALDLIEIAALAYAVDASISRGGPTDQQMAAKWHRRFVIEMSVFDLELWAKHDVKEALEETLMFLSGDRFEFVFSQREGGPPEQPQFFDFGPDSAWSPDTVMMFSGGLDSFAGALEEIIERKNKVALISHFSANKIAPAQHTLQKAITKKLGPGMAMHFPMRIQLQGGTNSEGTHRTRSFLFAALGAVTALSFGTDKVSFYENGVVSLNLPPVGNVLGTRATRTTHPQTLSRFTDLFSRIFAKPVRIDNPFFWRTKTDVLNKIVRLGMADQIAQTRSCADVHNQTLQYPHCGRCSQCIDRRFAVLAAGLERYDPEDAYRLDLMDGVRARVQDKETVLSYLRNAIGYEVMGAVDLEQRFPAILSAVEYLNEPATTALPRLADLLKRHGAAVTGVMRKTLAHRNANEFPVGSLPFLFGDLQQQRSFGVERMEVPRPEPIPPEETLTLDFDRKRKVLVINDVIELRGARYELLVHLAEDHLRCAGQGINLLDYTAIQAGT